ncbi:hypothetical protein ARMGADRAFT_1035300 [Armillaria gallica]|uniref:Uncharacterized protein n=1 Tax=Armillaria gallica TaxID=47427 RepID=A0A2H3CUN6_ARMGA|nr:hypothetical protein ARMGADRAFT_1035300 [Armillaria gallica]
MEEASKSLALSEAGSKKQMKATKSKTNETLLPRIEWVVNADSVVLLRKDMRWFQQIEYEIPFNRWALNMGHITIHISKALMVPQTKGPINEFIISGTSLGFGLFFKLVFSLLPKYILFKQNRKQNREIALQALTVSAARIIFTILVLMTYYTIVLCLSGYQDGGRQISIAQSYLCAGKLGVMLSEYYLLQMVLGYLLNDVALLPVSSLGLN